MKAIVFHKQAFFLLSFLAYALLLLSGCQPDSPEKTAPFKTVIPQLISAKGAAEWIRMEEGPIIIEISKEKQFLKGHLPNALNLWRPDYTEKDARGIGGMSAKKENLEKCLQKNGISSQDHLLIYDRKGSCDAARFAWILSLYGFDNYHIIDGGIEGWKKEGLPISEQKTPISSQGDFHFPEKGRPEINAQIKEVQLCLQDSNCLVIDTREPYEFLGLPFIQNEDLVLFKKGAYAAGCIPNSVHHNWSNAVDLKSDHCFKSTKDLSYDFEQKGIHPDKKIILYCQSGARSAHSYFVLKNILGYPFVKNYDGSWMEWTFESTQNQTVAIELKSTEQEIAHRKSALKEK